MNAGAKSEMPVRLSREIKLFRMWINLRIERSRCGEGMTRAKERGVRFGRPPQLTPHQRQEARARLEAGETRAQL